MATWKTQPKNTCASPENKTVNKKRLQKQAFFVRYWIEKLVITVSIQ